MRIAALPMFHLLDDVIVPATGDAGYVFAISLETQCALVKSFDGSDAHWFDFTELTTLTLGGAK